MVFFASVSWHVPRKVSDGSPKPERHQSRPFTAVSERHRRRSGNRPLVRRPRWHWPSNARHQSGNRPLSSGDVGFVGPFDIHDTEILPERLLHKGHRILDDPVEATVRTHAADKVPQIGGITRFGFVRYS